MCGTGGGGGGGGGGGERERERESYRATNTQRYIGRGDYHHTEINESSLEMWECPILLKDTIYLVAGSVVFLIRKVQDEEKVSNTRNSMKLRNKNGLRGNRPFYKTLCDYYISARSKLLRYGFTFF